MRAVLDATICVGLVEARVYEVTCFGVNPFDCELRLHRV